MKPPAPPELAEELIAAVWRCVEFDLEPLRAELLERLEEPSEVYVWERAERIVEEAIDVGWRDELIAQCEKALAEVHEHFLGAAARCGEAAQDLQETGRESWIARAVRHHLAHETAWRTLDERHGVEHVEFEEG